jgi:hypothetical protein
MIELQRAKLGLPPTGQSQGPPNSAASPKPSPHSVGITKQQTPEEAAVATMHLEDSQMERFINRLQKRDDTNHALFGGAAAATAEPVEGSLGPTVPTALSRRMLQRQGVGYLDNTVATVVSASADRFLATVLQQAVACRDQRLKGAAMAREAAKHRKRHMQHYEADTDDRKRRKEMIDDAREKVALDTINKGEAAKRGGAAKAASDGENTPVKKKGKKKSEPANGNKLDPTTKRLAEEEEEEYDSIDEEEEYYQETMGDVDRGLSDAGDDEDEDEDDTLLLKDVARPLEAWNFHLTGKEELESDGEQSDEGEPEDTGEAAKAERKQSEDDGMIFANGIDGKTGTNKDDDSENDGKKSSSNAVALNAS